METKDQNSIEYICRKYGIENYIINDDETVDVDGDVNLYKKGLTKLPIKFGKVTGYFFCGHNHLTTLEGAPYWVGKYFDCNKNKLTSLKGGPSTVLSYYACNDNQLVNFKGFPEDFEHEFIYIKDNPVSKLLKDITSEKYTKFIYWCNEYDAITDDGKVIPERMEEVYNKLGLVYED